MLNKSILNSGFGSPGETTRTFSFEYRKLRTLYSRNEACRRILLARRLTYQTLGLNVFDNTSIERILLIGDGELPFIVFADVFRSNHFSLKDNSQIVLENLEDILEVIIENYNSIVDDKDCCKNIKGLRLKAEEFINVELGQNIFDYQTNELFNHVWENSTTLSIFPIGRDVLEYRQDGFGAWIKKSDYNKFTDYGWRIVTNQEHGKFLPFHWMNTNRDKEGNILCKKKSSDIIDVEPRKECYIATVCYGSSDAEEVYKLREFRDQKLSRFILGRLFIQFYYLVSPFIAKRLVNMTRLNLFIRLNILDKIVRNI